MIPVHVACVKKKGLFGKEPAGLPTTKLEIHSSEAGSTIGAAGSLLLDDDEEAEGSETRPRRTTSMSANRSGAKPGRPGRCTVGCRAGMAGASWELPRWSAGRDWGKGRVSVTERASPSFWLANRSVLRMLTTDLFTRGRMCSRTVTSRSRCGLQMIGIIDSAISSRFIQFVNTSSLTVTGSSFALDDVHIIAFSQFDPSRGLPEPPRASPFGLDLDAVTGLGHCLEGFLVRCIAPVVSPEVTTCTDEHGTAWSPLWRRPPSSRSPSPP